MKAVITFFAAKGSLTFPAVDEALDFMDVQGLTLPGVTTADDLRRGIWWRVALYREGSPVGQVEVNQPTRDWVRALTGMSDEVLTDLGGFSDD